MKNCFLFTFLFLSHFHVQSQQPDNETAAGTHFINHEIVAGKYFNFDKEWYLENIPFFECSDKTLTDVYYYRWKLFKAHIRDVGTDGYVITEFLNAMSWDRKPYNSLNDATSFHIYEGRWLKDNQYINGYIDYLYQHGGNDRHFSEAIADAAYAAFLVNSDTLFIKKQLRSMISIFNQWYDHYDLSKGLYYIEPLLDATEYTISSIDASGGKDGFSGGEAFRPSINSYMYANALAIRNIALLEHDSVVAEEFNNRALQLKNNVQKYLWNDKFVHFVDRYKVSNKYVKYWNFIRGRELVGYLPWAYHLPDDNSLYASAWKHLVDSSEFAAKYGLRTNEPRYEYYMRQYRYTPMGEKECQWNGPSWPFQTSQVLLALKNLLSIYRHHEVDRGAFFLLLRQYALQHRMGNRFNLVEDYDADKGQPIVNLSQRSEHYNHSEFNDLVITGMCGLKPSDTDTLEVDPLIAPKTLRYFCLENVSYHGYLISIVYDASGRHYKKGRGLSVFVDGRKVVQSDSLRKLSISLPSPHIKGAVKKTNLALNIGRSGFPEISASHADTSTLDERHQWGVPANKALLAIDGRVWNFSEVRNYWSSEGSKNETDWLDIRFDAEKKVNEIVVYFVEDEKKFVPPTHISVWYDQDGRWNKVEETNRKFPRPVGNGPTQVSFKPVASRAIRVAFTNRGNGKYTGINEVEIY